MYAFSSEALSNTQYEDMLKYHLPIERDGERTDGHSLNRK